jgi:hypothetical protein
MSDLGLFGPGAPLRFSDRRSRSIVSDSVGAVRYPSPFFDLGSMYLPSSFKTMLKWCRYYFLTNPTINAVVYKMAAYPVTDLIIDSENEKLRDQWSYFFADVLQFKRFLVEVGLDYNAYGNAFISIYFPFRKFLICPKCHSYERASDVEYTFRDFKFQGTCRKCHSYVEFRPKDHYVPAYREVRMIRWNPEFISVLHNDATGESQYYFRVPGILANDIRLGKRHVVEKVPQTFIEAVAKELTLLFSSSNLYHMKRPTLADKDKGWGLPMIMPVLKDVYYLQILRKAQEAIAVEHAVPLRVLFPQAASASSDPYSTVNLTQWKGKIEQEILRWRLDNNYIPILPLPVGQETIGGDGRALMLGQEYRMWEEAIITGMGVPLEFVKGGLSYTGSSVSLRMLENHFLDQKSDHMQLVKFVMDRVSAFMGWPKAKARFKRFKMADDLQRSAFNLQLNQAGKISDQSLLEESEWDAPKEAERIAVEGKRSLESQRRQALGQAAVQGESQLVMQKYQMKGQKLMQQSGAQMDPMMMQQQQQMQQQMQGITGIPGQMSPSAAGGMQVAQQGMMNQMGQIPPLMPPEDVNQAAQQEQAQQQSQQAQEQDPAQQEGMPAAMQSPLQAGQPQGVSLPDLVNGLVAKFDQLPKHEQISGLQELAKISPQIFHLVQGTLQSRSGAHTNSASMPHPQQKPARRGPEATTG